jgi:hypothetical protein
MICGAVYYLACASLLAAQLPVAGGPPHDVEPGEFSQSYLDPPELLFSDVVRSDPTEEGYAKQLTDAKADAGERLTAAKALWRGRSRRYAADVLKFLAGPPPGGEPFRAFQREIEASIRPEVILRELREGDYLWGTWLAFLRPHMDLVPALIAGLKDKPEMAPETILALGNSGDPRALKPLLELLASKDYRTAGDAAQALGYLGDPEAEPKLIGALAEDNNWRQVKASGALAKMGTRRALPALERLAKDERYTGVLNVRGMAEAAVQRIRKREKP